MINNSESWLMVKMEPLMTKINNETPQETSTFLPAINSQTTEIKTNTYYNDILVLDEIPEFDTQDYDIYNDKDFERYIADIEKIVRTSREYRLFVDYLRENMDMNKCSFLQNVTNKDTYKIKIELHHSPFTLYEIVMTVFNKRLFYGESLEVEMVAKEVMYVHYFLMVGIIPLSETVHELVHTQSIFIPLGKSMGNWEEFMEIYGEWIEPETKDKIEQMRTHTLAYNEERNLAILQQSPTILQLPNDTGEGLYDMPTSNMIEDSMLYRIDDIKKNNYQLPVDPQLDNNIKHLNNSRKEELRYA